MMPSILLLGASGLLGSHLAARLPASFRTFSPLPREDAPDLRSGVSWLTTRLDALDEGSVAAVLDEAGAQVVVNAIGLPSGAWSALDAINRRFPQRLASLANERGAHVIHISTDAVFSGARGGYTEDDVPDPVDDYGTTKLAGELPRPHVTIRTSFFGRSLRGHGLVAWLLAQAGRGIDGYTDYRFSGVSAPVLADLIARAIDAPVALKGVYHVGGEPVTKFELLAAIAARLRVDVAITPIERGVPVDRTLNADRFFAAVGSSRPTLAESLAGLSA